MFHPSLITGQSLFYNGGTAYYTPWAAAGGNGANAAFSILAIHGSGTLTVTVETKKPGDDDSAIGATDWSSGSKNSVAIHAWKAGQEAGDGATDGFNGLIRLKIEIGGTVTADGVYFDMLPMGWLT